MTKVFIFITTILLSATTFGNGDPYRTGISMNGAEQVIEYTIADYNLALQNEMISKDDPFWQLYYNFRFDAEHFAGVSCFFGSEAKVKDFLIKLFSSRDPSNERAAGSVLPESVEKNLLKFNIIDTRDVEDFGKRKVISISRCQN